MSPGSGTTLAFKDVHTHSASNLDASSLDAPGPDACKRYVTCIRPGCGRWARDGQGKQFCGTTCENRGRHDITFEDPRAAAAPGRRRRAAIVAFEHGAPDGEERWGKVCCSSFLGNFYSRTGLLTLAPANDPHDWHRFDNAEAAFCALKHWADVGRYEHATGQEAGEMHGRDASRSDASHAGYVDDLGAMRAVLEAKFAPGSPCARLLLETQDAFLLELSATSTEYFWSYNHDGSGLNLRGVMLMLIRDQMKGVGSHPGSWTQFIHKYLDLEAGCLRSSDWKNLVRKATRALRDADKVEPTDAAAAILPPTPRGMGSVSSQNMESAEHQSVFVPTGQESSERIAQLRQDLAAANQDAQEAVEAEQRKEQEGDAEVAELHQELESARQEADVAKAASQRKAVEIMAGVLQLRQDLAAATGETQEAIAAKHRKEAEGEAEVAEFHQELAGAKQEAEEARAASRKKAVEIAAELLELRKDLAVAREETQEAEACQRRKEEEGEVEMATMRQELGCARRVAEAEKALSPKKADEITAGITRFHEDVAAANEAEEAEAAKPRKEGEGKAEKTELHRGAQFAEQAEISKLQHKLEFATHAATHEVHVATAAAQEKEVEAAAEIAQLRQALAAANERVLVAEHAVVGHERSEAEACTRMAELQEETKSALAELIEVRRASDSARRDAWKEARMHAARASREKAFRLEVEEEIGRLREEEALRADAGAGSHRAGGLRGQCSLSLMAPRVPSQKLCGGGEA